MSLTIPHLTIAHIYIHPYSRVSHPLTHLCSPPGRDHQPTSTPHCQARHLPHQPLRERLHPPKKQKPPQDQSLDRRALHRRCYHPTLSRVRRTSHPPHRRRGRCRMQKARRQERHWQDRRHHEGCIEACEFLHHGSR